MELRRHFGKPMRYFGLSKPNYMLTWAKENYEKVVMATAFIALIIASMHVSSEYKHGTESFNYEELLKTMEVNNKTSSNNDHGHESFVCGSLPLLEDLEGPMFTSDEANRRRQGRSGVVDGEELYVGCMQQSVCSYTLQGVQSTSNGPKFYIHCSVPQKSSIVQLNDMYAGYKIVGFMESNAEPKVTSMPPSSTLTFVRGTNRVMLIKNKPVYVTEAIASIVDQRENIIHYVMCGDSLRRGQRRYNVIDILRDGVLITDAASGEKAMLGLRGGRL